MKKPLLIFATEGEAAQIRALRADLDIAICGVGVVECALSMAKIMETLRPEAVILCGIAGAYDKGLKVGDVVSVVAENTASLPAIYRKTYAASLFMTKSHCLCQCFHLCVSSCHAKTSCRSFYSTTGGLFFLLSVIRGTVQSPPQGVVPFLLSPVRIPLVWRAFRPSFMLFLCHAKTTMSRYVTNFQESLL